MKTRMRSKTHLRLEVNGLQTPTLKLHHCLEAFAVLCLQRSDG